jgi:hypothetical protein
MNVVLFFEGNVVPSTKAEASLLVHFLFPHLFQPKYS